MPRMCYTFDIYEDAAEEYKSRHADIWPELVEAIKNAGLSNYSLFRRGTQIVAYVEVEPDAETAFAKLAASELNSKWSVWFEDLIVNLTDAKGRLLVMDEVWHLD